MGEFVDITGKTYTRLVVLNRVFPPNKKGSFWLCKCICGKQITVRVADLNNGHTKSCGCLHKEKTSQANFKHGHSGKKGAYKTWKEMKSRCYNPKSTSWRFYGARGIKVCERWLHSFENFLADMGEKPSSEHSIDRIDSGGNYEPSNCRWEFLMTGAIAVIGFFGMRTINSIDEVNAKAQNVADDLHEHKTHVAENYSTNETIKRVHDRIDELNL